MRKFLIVIAATVTVSLASSHEKFVVDDFMAATAQASAGGWWYYFNDASLGGNSEVILQTGKLEIPDGDIQYAMRLKGKAGNKLGWDFIGLGVTLGNDCGCPGQAVPFDLSRYTTLTLRVKGDISGGRLTVHLQYLDNRCEDEKVVTLTDWADYEAALNPKLSKDWTVVKLDLRKDFKQPAWAKKVVPIEKVLQNAHTINFHFSSPDGDSIDFLVSAIEFN